jgi:hypothetical protein
MVFARIRTSTNCKTRRSAGHMRLKQSQSTRLSEAQRLERLSKLCDELQSAVDRAHDQRRLLEEVKQVAQELLSDEESKPSRNKQFPGK